MNIHKQALESLKPQMDEWVQVIEAANEGIRLATVKRDELVGEYYRWCDINDVTKHCVFSALNDVLERTRLDRTER